MAESNNVPCYDWIRCSQAKTISLGRGNASLGLCLSFDLKRISIPSLFSLYPYHGYDRLP